MPRWIVPSLALSAVLAFALFAIVARNRALTGPDPRFDLIPDMDYQEKYKTQSPNAMFADGRAMRLPVDGTVARGRLMADAEFYRGMKDGTWTVQFPIRIDASSLRRGQDRYDIYCSPCHGLSGYGDGMIAKRADKLQEGTWVPPASYHQDRLRTMPVGQMFNTDTWGIRTMPAYGPQIPEADRWAIIAYIRALQRSQNATMKDVPADIRPSVQ